MPAMSPTMTKGNIGKWIKEEGDPIEIGETILEVETDKATMELVAPKDGFIAKILKPMGTKDCEVGNPICIVVDNKEDIQMFSTYDSPKEIITAPPGKPTKKEPKQAVSGSTLILSKNDFLASPLAKRIAMEKSVDLRKVQGTGFQGQISKSDVLTYLSTSQDSPTACVVQPTTGQTPDEGFTDIEVSTIRAIIADRLMESKNTIPHYYLKIQADISKLQLLRKELNQQLPSETTKISLNEYFVKASALAMKQVPAVNSSWQHKFIRQYKAVNVSFAVSTSKGLLTPVIKSAESKGLVEISMNVKKLIEKARSGMLTPEEYTGGTFTISNLGGYGISEFSAIINPPQAAILAIGSGNSFEGRNVINFTLSCDHRVIDGAVGAEWLKAFKKLIEEPQTMLL